MRRCLLSILSIFYIASSHSQSLISNPSFEDRNTCTELRAVCAPEGWFRIPLDAVSNKKGTAGFFLGTHHENIVMEHVKRPGINRTYIYTRLLCPLEKGRDYIFTASFRTPNEQVFAHVNLLWLAFEPFRYQDRIARERQRNTITQENKIADQPYGWKEYEIRFTATGDERYLLIGNLERDMFPGKPANGAFIIYEIDNVKLVSTGSAVAPCLEIDENKQELYAHNYRHTPGKFIDEIIEKPSQPIPEKKPAIIDTPAQKIVVAPPVVNDTLIIPDVLFKFDKSELNPQFAYRLDTLINKIKDRVFKRIEILGHTDSLGNDAYNQKLSLSRAATVKKYLIDRLSYPADIISIKGFAATIPVSTNSNAAGRQKNRRVEIVLIR